MNPRNLAHSLLDLTPEQLAQMDHASLYSGRAHIPQQFQNMIAPFEHRAFAREAVQESPYLALPIALGTLAYQPYKALLGSRSEPSLNQVGQGLLGVGEGLMGLLRR